MKRMLISAVTVVAASAAFAAPASAQDVTIDPNFQIAAACYPGEKTDECLIRIARNAPDLVFDYAAWALYVAGDVAGNTIDDVKDACERHLSGCSVPMP